MWTMVHLFRPQQSWIPGDDNWWFKYTLGCDHVLIFSQVQPVSIVGHYILLHHIMPHIFSWTIEQCLSNTWFCKQKLTKLDSTQIQCEDWIWVRSDDHIHSRIIFVRVCRSFAPATDNSSCLIWMFFIRIFFDALPTCLSFWMREYLELNSCAYVHHEIFT